MYSNEYQKREYQSSNNVVPVKEVMAQNQWRMPGGYGEYSTLVPIRNRSEYDYKRFAQLIII